MESSAFSRVHPGSLRLYQGSADHTQVAIPVASEGNVDRARVRYLWIHEPAMHQMYIQQVKDGDGIRVLQWRRLAG